MTANPYKTERVRRAFVDVIGLSGCHRFRRRLTKYKCDYDLENIGEFTRENIERWLCTHAGDSQRGPTVF
jgi:hypothetical protein